MQHLEVLLRNAVDQAAKDRFGEYWWEKIHKDNTKENYNDFNNGIAQAIRKLEKEWKKKKRLELNLNKDDEIPEATPTFSHDSILAATDFGVWLNVFNAGLSTSDLSKQNDFLWPLSFSKTFRRYNNLGKNNPDSARQEVLRIVNEIKEYRNRLFHHDCIWIKSVSPSKTQAIDSIRHKINLVEKLIEAISPVTHSTLKAWGVFYHAKRICSVDEFDLYTASEYSSIDEQETKLLNSISKSDKSIVLNYSNTPIYMHKFR